MRSMVEGPRRCVMAPPSALRAATSPSLRDKEERTAAIGWRAAPNQINARYSPNALVAVSTTPTNTSMTLGEKRLAI